MPRTGQFSSTNLIEILNIEQMTGFQHIATIDRNQEACNGVWLNSVSE